MNLIYIRQHIQAVYATVVAIASLLFAVVIGLMAPEMAPIQRGTSHRFWHYATNVQLSAGGEDDWGADVYFVDDDWAAYDWFHMHGSRIYSVKKADVLADFDDVVRLLEQADQRGDDNVFIKGYRNWNEAKNFSHDAETLVKFVQRERRRKLGERNVESLAHTIASETLFWQRWRQANWYWSNIVFEWVFLSGLTVFAVWPGLRNQSIIRWSVHVALLPFLFFLPSHLGYATFSLTSAGPSGGVLYPYLLTLCRGGSMNSFDQWLLAHVPPILETLSAPIGSPMALTGMGMIGPTSALFRGLVCGFVLLAIYRGMRSLRVRSSTIDSPD